MIVILLCYLILCKLYYWRFFNVNMLIIVIIKFFVLFKRNFEFIVYCWIKNVNGYFVILEIGVLEDFGCVIRKFIWYLFYFFFYW